MGRESRKILILLARLRLSGFAGQTSKGRDWCGPLRFGGADEDRTRDLLTASFEPVVDSIELTGLSLAQSGITRKKTATSATYTQPKSALKTPRN